MKPSNIFMRQWPQIYFICNFVYTNIVNICIDAEVKMLVTSNQTNFKSCCFSIRCELGKSILDKLRGTNFIPVSVEVPGLLVELFEEEITVLALTLSTFDQSLRENVRESKSCIRNWA